MRIGLLSDTHSYYPAEIEKHFQECDEIWHAGDIGNIGIADQIAAFKPLKAVWGNIDGTELRSQFPLDYIANYEGLKVWMTHIGGYPGKYVPRVMKLMPEIKPDLFICGHSHIIKVISDKKLNLLHLNPGAAGKEGFHKLRSLMRFSIEGGKIQHLELIELGLRSTIHEQKH